MKLPRTYHLLWSLGVSSDDRVHDRAHLEANFLDKPLTITEKLDGACQCWQRESWHRRSATSTGAGALCSRAKAAWAAVRYQLDPDCHYYVEDLSNQHSIAYADLAYPFRLITVFDARAERFATWGTVSAIAESLGLAPVPLLHRDTFSTLADLEQFTTTLAAQPSLLGGVREGVVVRVDTPLSEWTPYSAKFVRAGHVQTSDRWTQERLQANQKTV